MRRWGLGLAFIAALAAGSATARIEVPAKARYSTQEGESQWYSLNVVFVSGSELNVATSSYRYGSFDHYAVIFFKQNEAAVIKLRGFYSCAEFTVDCLPSFGNAKGEDQQGRAWEVCTSSFC